MIFLDTCILIDYSRGKINLDLTNNYCINSIVKLEFKVGALNNRELKKINRILSQLKLLETDQSILDLADILIEKYAVSFPISHTIYNLTLFKFALYCLKTSKSVK